MMEQAKLNPTISVHNHYRKTLKTHSNLHFKEKKMLLFYLQPSDLNFNSNPFPWTDYTIQIQSFNDHPVLIENTS